MNTAPPTRESLPLSPCDDEFTSRSSTVDKVPASQEAKIVDLRTWKLRPVQADRASLISAVCQRAAHLAGIAFPRSKP